MLIRYDSQSGPVERRMKIEGVGYNSDGSITVIGEYGHVTFTKDEAAQVADALTSKKGAGS